MIRPAKDAIRWPPAKECRGRCEDPEAVECICRAYDGAEGFYVIGEDRHAQSYFLDRKDAVAKVTTMEATTNEHRGEVLGESAQDSGLLDLGGR